MNLFDLGEVTLFVAGILVSGCVIYFAQIFLEPHLGIFPSMILLFFVFVSFNFLVNKKKIFQSLKLINEYR